MSMLFNMFKQRAHETDDDDGLAEVWFVQSMQ